MTNAQTAANRATGQTIIDAVSSNINNEEKNWHFTILVIEDGSEFGVGCVKAGESGRRRSNGPLEPGPWAYTWDNSDYSGRRWKGVKVSVKSGDLIQVDGNVYRIEVLDVRGGGFPFNWKEVRLDPVQS